MLINRYLANKRYPKLENKTTDKLSSSMTVKSKEELESLCKTLQLEFTSYQEEIRATYERCLSEYKIHCDLAMSKYSKTDLDLPIEEFLKLKHHQSLFKNGIDKQISQKQMFIVPCKNSNGLVNVQVDLLDPKGIPDEYKSQVAEFFTDFVKRLQN